MLLLASCGAVVPHLATDTRAAAHRFYSFGLGFGCKLQMLTQVQFAFGDLVPVQSRSHFCKQQTLDKGKDVTFAY